MTETTEKKLGEAQTKLVAALHAAKAPAWMLDRALDGSYDDYKSEFAKPINALVLDCRRFGLVEMAERAKKGEFDGTAADALAWEQQEKDPEVMAALKTLRRG